MTRGGCVQPPDSALCEQERLLEIGHVHLAFMHACEHEEDWSDERKLELVEAFHAHGADAPAITLCHRWKLSRLCSKTKPQLYQELFPKLPPRTPKGDRP